MHRAGLVLFFVALLVAACKDEPSFDERYDAAQKRLEKTAQEIDQDLEKSDDLDRPSATKIETSIPPNELRNGEQSM